MTDPRSLLSRARTSWPDAASPGNDAPSRLLRGTVLGTLVVGLSAVGHAGAGGGVNPLALLLLVAASIVACTALSAWEWTLPRLLAVLGASQVVIHLALEATMAPMTSEPAASMAGMPGTDGAAGMASTVGVEPMAQPGAWMLWAHVVAVVAGALLVRYGEATALALFAALASLAAPLLSPPRRDPALPVWLPAPALVAWEPCGGRTLVLGTTVRRRGPPAPACG